MSENEMEAPEEVEDTTDLVETGDEDVERAVEGRQDDMEDDE